MGFLIVNGRIGLAYPPLSRLWQACRGRAQWVGSLRAPGSQEEGWGGWTPPASPPCRCTRVSHHPSQGGCLSCRNTAGAWKECLPNSGKRSQPSCEVVTVWPRGRSPDLEKQKDLDSEPGSATWHLCGWRAGWQPGLSQWVSVTGAEVGEGRGDGKREAWWECRAGGGGGGSARARTSSWN